MASPASLEEEGQDLCQSSNLGEAKLVQTENSGGAAHKVARVVAGCAVVGSIASLVWAEKLAVGADNVVEYFQPETRKWGHTWQ